MITDRIPIVSMFIPSHIGGDKPPIDFGSVFDVQRLARGIGIPVLEWHEVKNRSSNVLDELGCWNTWEAVQYDEAFPRKSVVPNLLSLGTFLPTKRPWTMLITQIQSDISYTKAPSWIKVVPHFEHDKHAYFWALASLAFPEGRQENLQPPLASPIHHAFLPPDEQLLCYDYLYYACAHQVSCLFVPVYSEACNFYSHMSLNLITVQHGDMLANTYAGHLGFKI